MDIPIGSMVLVYMRTWIPSIYPSHVSIYTSTMDPMGYDVCSIKNVFPKQGPGPGMMMPNDTTGSAPPRTACMVADSDQLTERRPFAFFRV